MVLALALTLDFANNRQQKANKENEETRTRKNTTKKGDTHDDGVRYAKLRLIVLVFTFVPLSHFTL